MTEIPRTQNQSVAVPKCVCCGGTEKLKQHRYWAARCIDWNPFSEAIYNSFGITHTKDSYVDEFSEHVCAACVNKQFWSDNLPSWRITGVLWIITLLVTWFVVDWGSQPGSSDAGPYRVVAVPSGRVVRESQGFEVVDDSAVFLGLGAILLCVFLVGVSLFATFQSALSLQNTGGKVAYTHGSQRQAKNYYAVSTVRLFGFYQWIKPTQ